MRWMRRVLLAVLPCAVLGACASGGSPLQQGGDGGPDIDAAPHPDSDEQTHDGPPDAFVPDAFVPDAFVPDAFVPDAFVPDAPTDACVPIVFEHLVNPVFDLTPQGTGWVDQRDPRTNALPGGPFPIISPNPTGLTAQSPPNKAWLGGAAGEDVTPQVQTLTDQLFQDIAVPANATQIVVSGFFLVGTNEAPGTAFDFFSLDITQTNGTPIENVLAANNNTVAGTFTPFTHTMSAGALAQMAGQTIRLRAVSTNDITLLTNFFLDSFSVKITHCP
jgi:hypothetical protein